MTNGEARIAIYRFLEGSSSSIGDVIFYLQENAKDNQVFNEPIVEHWTPQEGFSDKGLMYVDNTYAYNRRSNNELDEKQWAKENLYETNILGHLNAITEHPTLSELEKSKLTLLDLDLFKREIFKVLEQQIINEEDYFATSWFKLRWSWGGSVLKDLKKFVREKSIAEQITAYEHESRMETLYKFMGGLESSFQDGPTGVAHGFKDSKDSKIDMVDAEIEKETSVLWFHRSDIFYIVNRKDDDYKISLMVLVDTAKMYLLNPFLQHPKLDYCFIDAFVYSELREFVIDCLIGRIAAKNISFDAHIEMIRLWTEVGGDPKEFISKKAMKILKKGLMVWLLCPLGIILSGYYFFSQELGSFLAGVYGVIIFLKLVVAPILNKPQMEDEKRLNSVKTNLSILYDELEGDVIDLNHIKYLTRQLSLVDGKGAKFFSVFHAVLSRAIKVNPDGILFLDDRY